VDEARHRGRLAAVTVGTLALFLVLAVDAGYATMQGASTAGAPQVAAMARASVAQALYAAAVTQQAAARRADQRLVDQRKQIDALRTQLAAVTKSGIEAAGAAAQLRDQIRELQESYVAALAAADKAYAVEAARYRRYLEDIATTNEGAAALARFNRGEEVEALADLDRLREDRARVRQQVVDRESAADGRQTAVLAADARARGNKALTTASVLKRFGDVTSLDPSLSSDWAAMAALLYSLGG
jgi:hypothetical protein